MFDRSAPISQESGGDVEDEEEIYDVILYFRNRAEPLTSTTEDEDHLDEIFEELEADPFANHQFFSFTDEDGELLTLNAQHLVLLMIQPHRWSEEDGE